MVFGRRIKSSTTVALLPKLCRQYHDPGHDDHGDHDDDLCHQYGDNDDDDLHRQFDNRGHDDHQLVKVTMMKIVESDEEAIAIA